MVKNLLHCFYSSSQCKCFIYTVLSIVIGFKSIATAGLKAMCFKVKGDCGFPCMRAVQIQVPVPVTCRTWFKYWHCFKSIWPVYFTIWVMWPHCISFLFSICTLSHFHHHCPLSQAKTICTSVITLNSTSWLTISIRSAMTPFIFVFKPCHKHGEHKGW